MDSKFLFSLNGISVKIAMKDPYIYFFLPASCLSVALSFGIPGYLVKWNDGMTAYFGQFKNLGE